MNNEPTDPTTPLPLVTRRMTDPSPDFNRWYGEFFGGTPRSEVLMAVRDTSGGIWLHRKTDNPGGVWRLPTGKLNSEEPILPGLEREVDEEFGIILPVIRPLGTLRYEAERRPEVFHSYLFLLEGGDHIPSPKDLSEGLEAFRTVSILGLREAAQALRRVPVGPDPFGWRDPYWGWFRAVEHEVVADLLERPDEVAAFSLDRRDTYRGADG